MRLKGMIFDLDGTLGDTLPVCFRAFRQAIFEYTGRSLSDVEIRATFGPSEEGIIRNQVPDRWQECLALYVDAYRSEHAKWREPFPGVNAVLRQLGERGVHRGVVTGKSIVTAEISLKAMGIRSFFDIVQGGAAEGNIKAENIRKVLESWSLAPGETAYVGDAPADIDSAHDAGVIGLAAAWGDCTDDQIDMLMGKRPAAIFYRVDEMMEWLQRNE